MTLPVQEITSDVESSIKVNLLIVDDRKENLLALENLLEGPDVTIFKASSGNDALALMIEHDFALVLLDVQMPDMDGFETAELMRGSEKTKHIPIIFVTAISKEQKNVFKGYEAGAVDYLFKPLDPSILKNKVNVFLDLHRKQVALEKYAEELKSTISELEKSKRIIEEKNKLLNHLSVHDGLTGLYNHRHMEALLKQEFGRAQRYQTDLSCLLIDLDYFKQVNDTYGHAYGDFVLKEFSQCLIKYTRSSDFSFRYGGEEFMVMLPNTEINEAYKTGDKIRRLTEKKAFQDQGHVIKITISIGIASLKEHTPENANELLSYADKALYRAKAEGRNRVKLYLKQLSKHDILEKNQAEKGIHFLKERLSAILEKTKMASLASLELLVRDMGGNKFQEHNRRVLHYMGLITERLRLPPGIADTFKRAAALHDCFKVLIGESKIGQKKILSEDDLAQIQSHPYLLAGLTELFDFFTNERSVLLYHHENYDGSGYPEGLQGDQIPLGARIFAIADAMVAMTSPRTYKKQLTEEEVLHEFSNNAGSQFDPMLVSMFIDVLKDEDFTGLSEDVFSSVAEKIKKACQRS